MLPMRILIEFINLLRASVLEYLVHRVQCLGLFSTHYHRLAAENKDSKVIDSYLVPWIDIIYALNCGTEYRTSQVSLCHMACEISKGEGGLEEVTFLYKLTPGSCPKSYGVNVARLAGYFQANILATAFTQNSLANLIGEQVPNTQTCILISRNTCISASKG